MTKNSNEDAEQDTCLMECMRPLNWTSLSTWTTSVPISITGSRSSLYDIMCDVKQWPRWDVGLQESFLHYPGQGIHDGAQGTLIMKENRGTFVFTLCDLNATKGFFAYQTELKGANAVWFWDFTQNGATDKEFILDMGVTFTGWLAPAYKVYLEKECHEAFEKCAVLLKGLVEGSGLSETKK